MCLNEIIEFFFPIKRNFQINTLETDITKHQKASFNDEWIFSAYDYHSIKNLIIHLKKQSDYATAKVLVKPIRDWLAETEFEIHNLFGINQTILVPVPSPKKTKLKKGFNHAELIAKTIAKSSPHRFVRNILSAIPHQKQASLSRKDRLVNMQNTFFLNNKTTLEKKSLVVLVDDVATTGATLREARRAIKVNFKDAIILAVTIAS